MAVGAGVINRSPPPPPQQLSLPAVRVAAADMAPPVLPTFALAVAVALLRSSAAAQLNDT